MKWRYSPAAKPEKGEKAKGREIFNAMREDRNIAKLFGIMSTSRKVHTVHYSAILGCNTQNVMLMTDTVKNNNVFP